MQHIMQLMQRNVEQVAMNVAKSKGKETNEKDEHKLNQWRTTRKHKACKETALATWPAGSQRWKTDLTCTWKDVE